ncbi:MAG: GNAT family N-acetyltransferase [Pseudomonadota bacterium]
MSETHRITVTGATSADVAAISQIGTQSFRDAYGEWTAPAALASHLDDYFSERAVRQVMDDGSATYLIARVGDEAGGLLLYRHAPCPSGPQYADALELWQLYIDPRMQRLGLGRHLVNALIEHSHTVAANGIWLSVWQDADWAQRFYASCGFQKVGIAAFDIGNESFSDDILWRPPD